MSDDYEIDDEEDRREISRRTGQEKKAVRGRPFVAGQSGNPKGTPKVEGIKDLRVMAREFTELALETLVEVMSNPEEKGAARVAAAGHVLDRGWGKAPQTVVVDGEINVDRLDRTDLDEATRRELARYVGGALAGAIEAQSKDKLN